MSVRLTSAVVSALSIKICMHETRVAEVGKLSASAKNALNSFVGRIFANSRQKTLFFRVLPKLQQKGSFYLVLPIFYLVLLSLYLVLTSFY